MNNIIDVYKKLPLFMRTMLKNAYSMVPLHLRLGKEFLRKLEFLERSQWWSRDEIAAYQDEQLRLLVEHAYTNTFYYRTLFDSLKLKPSDIRTIQDLQKIPILKKDDLRNNYEQMRARNFKNRDVVKFSTSGTTGTPVVFYFDKKKDHLNADPFSWRFFRWAGHQLGQIRATISCWTTKGMTTIYNPVRNLLILSAYTMNKEHVGIYARALKKHRVEYIDGYPGTIELLTRFLQDAHHEPPVRLKAVFCHSEHLYEWQRNLIEMFWGCKCFNWYSMEESVVFGIECDRHEGLHLCPEFGITEFVDCDVLDYKRLVATGFNNYATPLIRYDTGDVAMPLNKECSCGRHFPLFLMGGGRKRNFVVSKDGSYISITNVDIPGVSEQVQQFQFVQKEQGKMELLLVKKDMFTDSDLKRIKEKLFEKFAHTMDIGITFVNPEELIRTGRNKKNQLLVQMLSVIEDNGIFNKT